MKPAGHFPLLPRKKHTNKSHYGHVLVIAGSSGMTGAAVLTSQAALAAGSGLVTLGTPKALQGIAAKHLVEVMTKALPEAPAGALSDKAFKEISAFIKKRGVSALAVGPGLSTRENTARLVHKIISGVRIPVVLDADGLNAFKGKTALLKKHQSALILTPHKGEFERLFSRPLPGTLKARIELAKKLSAIYDVVLVLKDTRSLVVYKDRFFVNDTGNPGMAKGGSGDVLTGILAAFIAQGLKPFEAAKWAVYVHGKAGDWAVKKTGELSLAARDIIQALPKVFRNF